MNFPQYRKYKNIETFFKIISEKEFEEIGIVGNKYVKYKIEAQQYPEIMRIQDMLLCREESWEVLTQEEYEEKEKEITSRYTNINKKEIE